MKITHRANRIGASRCQRGDGSRVTHSDKYNCKACRRVMEMIARNRRKRK